MSTNRISSYLPDSSDNGAAPVPTTSGFVLCPQGNSPHALMLHLAALQQAYRDQIAAAERRAVQTVMERAMRAGN